MRNLQVSCLIVLLIMVLGLHDDNDRLRERVQQLEIEVAILLSRPPPKPAVVDLSDIHAELAEGRRRTDGLCFALRTVARVAAGRERLAGDMDWCDLPDRIGEGHVWKKHGWGTSPKEAAEIRGKFRKPEIY
jgi:hypothetical protein